MKGAAAGTTCLLQQLLRGSYSGVNMSMLGIAELKAECGCAMCAALYDAIESFAVPLKVRNRLPAR